MIKRFKFMNWLASTIVLAALAAVCGTPGVAEAQSCGPNVNMPAQYYTVGFEKGTVLHYTVQLTLTMGSIIDEPGVDVDTLTQAGSYLLYLNGKPEASGSLVGFADDCTGGTRPLYAYVEFETNAAETAGVPLGQPGHMAHWTAQGGVPADGVGWRIALRSAGGTTIVAEQPAGDPPGTPRVGNAWPADQVIVSNGLLTAQAMEAQLDTKFPQSVLAAPALASSGVPSSDYASGKHTINEDSGGDPPPQTQNGDNPGDQDSDNSVDIDPVYQQESEWCWAAVGQMVFEYFNVPGIQDDYQCGIVSLLNGHFQPVAPGRLQWVGPCFPDCQHCDIPAGQFQNLRAMLGQYPAIAATIKGQHVPSLVATLSNSALSKSTVQNEIDAGRPVIAGVSPTGPMPAGGEAEHVVLIVGYFIESNKFSLLVNDPWPFDGFPNMQNPYIAAGGESKDQGQYKIEISQFTSRLRWTRALWNIRKSGM
jgi:hypothetical protein